MKNALVSSLLAAAMLAAGACATVPLADEGPRGMADQISSNVVAYNEAYGHAIADQVLLNVLRARDRLPLYHLSMSGITEGSSIATERSLSVGSVPLGGGGTPIGVGQVGGQRTATTNPGYSLNPFSSDGDHARVRQFESVPPAMLQHFWDNDWPREILLLVMVDDMTPLNAGGAPIESRQLENTSTNYRDDCQPRPAETDASAAQSARCAFLWTLQDINDGQGHVSLRQTAGCSASEDASPRRRRTPRPPCQTILTVEDRGAGGRTHATAYRLNLRAVDDMIYYVGSLLRHSCANDYCAQVSVHPNGWYPADGAGYSSIPRSAPLFRVSVAPGSRRTARRGDFAAEVEYRGARYRAGPANSAMCFGAECANNLENSGDVSATVLSLLTQLVIISQSESAQLAPQWVAPARAN